MSGLNITLPKKIVEKLRADLTTATARIATLTTENATLRGALKPFAYAQVVAVTDNIDDETYETGEGFYRVDIYHWQQASRALSPATTEVDDERPR